MSADTVQQLRQAFREYTRRFATADGSLPPMLQLKVDHTRRVTADARLLARQLQWPAQDCRLGEIAALFHDIGRFEQCRRYGTFADARSVDHGELGLDILDRHDLLKPLPYEDRQTVRTAVRWHNKRDLPRHLPEARERILSLVRDSDKIDIMRIIGDAIREGDFAANPEVLLNVDPQGPPTPALVREIRSGATGSYANVRSLVDMKLVGFAWTRDIRAIPALDLIRKRELLDAFAAELLAWEDIRDLVRGLDNQMKRRLDTACCTNSRPHHGGEPQSWRSEAG